jgi:hypothetical protein
VNFTEAAMRGAMRSVALRAVGFKEMRVALTLGTHAWDMASEVILQFVK